ncbi:ABC transporter substrate-binding protein [Cryptosporangium phraense]|uniref:ABC transporter substrate-binding protein n=1 Tax=Cryptosporangium phraense TaxID=2593070 RepID=A0A545AUU8_9ACTN|nr:ABC transporter substrate-binding protein [Cryptosporangium phraense]TQS45118.1 ABC transporter substrate-binding protein [Cryptosporangium phraense]
MLRRATRSVEMRQSVFLVPTAAEVARRRSLFAQYGVEATTVPVVSSAAQRQDLDANRADVGITSTDNLFAWNAAGSDLAVIAQIETTTDLVLMLRPGLSSVAGATRVRLAVDAPANGFAIVAYSMLARLGLPAARYEVVEVGGVRERFSALSEGSVDASLLSPPLDELGLEHGMTVALRIQDLTRSYPGFGVVADRSVVSSRLDEVAAYLRALDAANRWLSEGPRAEVETELRDIGLGPAAVAAVFASIPATLEPSSQGLMLLERMRRDVGLALPDAPRATELVDLRPLRAAGLLADRVP